MNSGFCGLRFAVCDLGLGFGVQDYLPPTDSRLRPDQRALENGEYDYAFETKLKLETRQRKVEWLLCGRSQRGMEADG